MSLDHCAVCPERKATPCSTCFSARYCSPTCREQDKAIHSILCNDFAVLISTPRPTDICNIAFLFPVDAIVPQVIGFEKGLKYEKDTVTGLVTSSFLFGDVEYLNTEKFIGVNVPTNHPIFDNINVPCLPTEVSKMIELPIMFRRILPDFAWKDLARRSWTNKYKNEAAEFLDLETNPASVRWGCPDAGRAGNPQGQIYGRVLVIRKDKADITPHQIEAITAFFQSVSKELKQKKVSRLRGLLGGRLCEERGKLMAEHISKTKFETFFKDFKKVHCGDTSQYNELHRTTSLRQQQLTANRMIAVRAIAMKMIAIRTVVVRLVLRRTWTRWTWALNQDLRSTLD
jgi:MYND finger